MRVVYACSFDLSRFSGKERATRQKLNALKHEVVSLTIFSGTRGSIRNLILLPIIELRCILYLFNNKTDVFISRGYVG